MPLLITKNCQPLFDAFTAEGLNAQQELRDMASIVQNNGIELSIRDINKWADDATQRLLVAHRRQLQMISNTVHAFRAMAEEQ